MSVFQQLIKEPESRLIARFQDCDPFGHLNNARYIDYFLNARQDQVTENYGINIYERNMQASWVVRKTQIAYIRPVSTMEEVLVRTRLINFDENSLVVEGLMLDREGKQLKALVWFDFVYVSLTTGRPAKHPEELSHLFEAVVITEDYHPNNFNRRVEAARRHNFQKDFLSTAALASVAQDAV